MRKAYEQVKIPVSNIIVSQDSLVDGGWSKRTMTKKNWSEY